MSLTASKIYNQAMHYLQRYSSSSENLRRVLQQKTKRRQMRFNDVPPEAMQWVDQAVEKCLTLKLVDDNLYAEGRINVLRRQGRSKHYILRHLTQKSVDKKIILNYLGEGDEDDFKAARRFVEKKRLGKNKDREAQQKDLGKMMRAGFSMSIAKKALNSDLEIDESFED